MRKFVEIKWQLARHKLELGPQLAHLPRPPKGQMGPIDLWGRIISRSRSPALSGRRQLNHRGRDPG